MFIAEGFFGNSILPRRARLLDEEDLTHFKEGWFVDGEYLDGGPANRCQSGQRRRRPCEMLCPAIFAGIKQPDKLARLLVRSRDVRTFVRVAMQTGEGKVVKRGLAAVLACNHVVDAKGFVGRRSDMAVFASGTSTLTDLPANLAIHELRDFNATRAFDCRTARKFAICR